MRKLTGTEKRLFVYVVVGLVVLVWDIARRRWTPDTVQETDHYVVYSTATAEQTEDVARVAEIVYEAYSNMLGELGRTLERHPRLSLKLFKDRDEFRLCNRVRGWAEGFYRGETCYFYHPNDEPNAYHWMMHEAVHQLNAEVGKLSLSKWMDEGLACYVSTSRLVGDRLHLGEIDGETYPVWWLHIMASTGELDADKANGSVIPLQVIVGGLDGPDMDTHFNLYYLHWWTLTDFLLQYGDGKYRAGYRRLLTSRGGISDFEQCIGPVERVEREWYEHVLEIKTSGVGLAIPRKPPQEDE